MKKVLLIPDSFKGTMSSSEICDIMQKVILRYYPDCEVHKIPVADGGEGSVEAFLTALGGEQISVDVHGPYMEMIKSFYGLLPGNVAVIEMAAAAGLPLVGENKHAELTTTYGVGELIKHAAQISKAQKIILGLGGSATNDGGAGMAAALGVKFLQSDKTEFVPVGKTLSQIAAIDLSGLIPELKNIPVIAMCDIDNPLCGANGAAAIFGPQKGADEKTVELLDRGLQNLAAVAKKDLGFDILNLPGAGAAGGMGGGAVTFLNAKLQMGIETVLDTVGFDALLQNADMVFTGEGKIDGQSLRGKVVIGIARRTKKKNVPLVAIVGDIGDEIEGAYQEGVTGIFTINRIAAPYKELRLRAKSDLELTFDNLIRFMKNTV